MQPVQKSVAPTAAQGYKGKNKASPAASAQVMAGASTWTCTALVPDARGTKRVQCGAVNNQNNSQSVTCRECGAPNVTNRRDTNMATTNKPSTDKSKTNEQNKSTDAKSASVAAPAASKPSVTPATTGIAAASAAQSAAPATGASGSTTKADVASLPTTDASGREIELGGKQPDQFKGLPRMRFYSTRPGAEDYCVRILPIFHAKYGAPRDPWGDEMKLRPKQAKEFGAPDYKPAKVQRAEAKESRDKKLAAMTDEQKLAFLAQERKERADAKAKKQADQKAALMAELRKELESQGLLKTEPAAK